MQEEPEEVKSASSPRRSLGKKSECESGTEMSTSRSPSPSGRSWFPSLSFNRRSRTRSPSVSKTSHNNRSVSPSPQPPISTFQVCFIPEIAPSPWAIGPKVAIFGMSRSCSWNSSSVDIFDLFSEDSQRESAGEDPGEK
jgi:hypothetical protein